MLSEDILANNYIFSDDIFRTAATWIMDVEIYGSHTYM